MSDIYSETEVYHTLDLIGKGTFGKVLKCWRGSDGEIVAIKIMKNDANRNRVIKNELKLIAVLSRSNLERSHIVHFIEAFRDQRHHYLVFEMLEKNLYEFQKENGFRPLPVCNIRTITCQILRALARLKELAIIHADLKPENIMIVDQHRYPFRVKLIDFGSASIFSEVRFVKEPYIQSRFYRSPEILLGLPFCEKVDMWSLGCVMAELLLGWPLYPGDSEFDQVRYICETQGLPSPHLLNMASKTSLYFKLSNNEHGAPTWQLMQCSFGGQTSTEGGHTQTATRGKFIFSSLDQLCNIHITELEAFQNDSTVAEVADLHCMVELIKRALTIDSHQRINPNAALRHPFTTLAHLHGPGMQSYYDGSLQELQKALIPMRSSAGHSDKNRSPKAGYKEIFEPYQDQHVYKQINDFALASDGNDLSSESEACQHFPEGDHYHRLKMPYQLNCGAIQSYGSTVYDISSEVKDVAHQREHHEPYYEGQTVQLAEVQQQSPSLNQMQNSTWKMEGLCLTDTGAWGNTPASWTGELPAGPIHNHGGVISELQTWPTKTKIAEHSLIDFSLIWPHTEEATHNAAMPTSLKNMIGNPQALRQPNARPCRSDPTSGPRPISPLQVDAESSKGSFEISLEMLAPQVMFSPMHSSAEELCRPPQLFTVERSPSNQQLFNQGQYRPPQCSYTNLNEVHLAPYEAEACQLHSTQWAAEAVCNPEPGMLSLCYSSSTSPSYSSDNHIHQHCVNGNYRCLTSFQVLNS